MNYLPLSQAAQIVLAKSVDENGKSLRRDYEVALGEFVSNMENIFTVNSPTGELKFSKHGFGQLVRDRLGLPPAIFDRSDLKNSTKLAILRDVAGNGHANDVIKVRVAGSQVQAVVSNDYSFFDNMDLMASLERLRQKGSLPEATYVMNGKDFLSSDGRGLHLRLVSPEWDFTIGENGSTQNFLGNLVTNNNELAMGSFSAKSAITRHACLNSIIGESLFRVNHRFADKTDFTRELNNAVIHISKYARELGDALKLTQHVNVSSPMLIFDKIAKELGLPVYVMDSSKQYWQSEGSKGTLYDVVQALSHGSKKATENEGRRKANWQYRSDFENKIWRVAQELQQISAEGESVEDWYLSDSEKLRQRVLSVVWGYEQMSPIVPEIAYQIESLELN